MYIAHVVNTRYMYIVTCTLYIVIVLKDTTHMMISRVYLLYTLDDMHTCMDGKANTSTNISIHIPHYTIACYTTHTPTHYTT